MTGLNQETAPLKKIVVIGGTGETGRRIIQALRARCPYLCVSSAARRQDRGEALPRGVSRIGLDIDDCQTAVPTLRKFDLAIIALGPMDAYGARPHELCLQAGIDCVDINDCLRTADEIQALDGAARAKGRRILTGMGLTPGLSGLLLMKLVRETASADGTYRSRFYAGAAYGGGETSPYVLLDSFKPTLTAFINGKRQNQPAPWSDAHSEFTFAGHTSPVKLIAYSAPEMSALGCSHFTGPAASINTLDYRYHIQFLSQSTARLIGRLNHSEGMRKRLANLFYSNGQFKKNSRKADPECCLWVYPDNRPADGWVVQGCISSYDLAALTACAAVQWLVSCHARESFGVYSMEQLPDQARLCIEANLRHHGVTARRARELEESQDPLYFGWCQVVTGDTPDLRHYGKCWYDAVKPPRMSSLQTSYLYHSAVWKRLQGQSYGPARIGLVTKFLWRWCRHYQQLASFRRNNFEHGIVWAKITRDISMFTSGYSCVRDALGATESFALYRQMFLATGQMEMRWLWPGAEILAAMDHPPKATLNYWQAFMDRYQTLGLLKGERTHDGYRIDHCAFAQMFTRLGCPELGDLMREMEHEALVYMARLAAVDVDWRYANEGRASISLRSATIARAMPQTNTSSAPKLSFINARSRQ